MADSVKYIVAEFWASFSSPSAAVGYQELPGAECRAPLKVRQHHVPSAGVALWTDRLFLSAVPKQ